jgi:hypothetical protein
VTRVKRRRKRTPEEEAAFREFRRQADENERRLRERVATRRAEREARRGREQQAGG